MLQNVEDGIKGYRMKINARTTNVMRVSKEEMMSQYIRRIEWVEKYRCCRHCINERIS